MAATKTNSDGIGSAVGSDSYDLENQQTHSNLQQPEVKPAPKSLGAGVSGLPQPCELILLTFQQTALAIGAFGTTLTTLSLSLMEWRGVTITNVYVGNFFFIAAFGLVVTAQWELAIGNGFAYTVFSAFGMRPLRQGTVIRADVWTGLFYAGYAAILTPGFGILSAYDTDPAQLNNALGFFMIRKSSNHLRLSQLITH